MTKHYIYAKQWGNSILYRGYKNGKQITERIEFKPTLFVPSKTPTQDSWRSLYTNTSLEAMKFDSIKEAKGFLETYKDVAGFEIHGFQKFEYQLINDMHPGDIDYNIKDVRIHTIDLEVVSTEKDGFPNIETADTPIVLISIHDSKTDKTYVFGLKEYELDEEDEFEYLLFKSEKALLSAFIAFTQKTAPDIWTGWNIDQFDVPYLINRIMRLFDENTARKLSPFNIIREKTIKIRGKEIQTYEIFGIVSLDYLELYKKYGTYGNKESWALGFISQEELGRTKLDLPGTSFRDSYVNHFRTFVKYNAIDSILVKELESKLKLIELAFAMAYMYHCNLTDIYRTVIPWEVFIYNHLAEHKIAVPPRKNNIHGEVEGAWVKEGKQGLYGWTLSFDFKGLYPHIEWQWNISPETFIPPEFDVRTSDFLEKKPSAISAIQYAKEHNCSIAANGAMFDKTRVGFLPTLMEYCIVGRSKAKNEMLELEKQYEKTKNKSLLPRIAALDNKQKALKIAANACYGALGNEGFHYYDFRIAEAVTLSGQLSDRHLAGELNKKFNEIIGTTNVDYVMYGDTDSVYMNCDALVEKFMPCKSVKEITDFLDAFSEKVCQKVINNSVNHIYELMNCKIKVMGSKREAIASKMLFRSRKNYAMYVHNSEGVAYYPPKLKVLGLEIVRSSTPQWCRKKLKELLMMMFETNEETFRTRFAEVEKEFRTLEPNEIAFPKGVSDIDKYFNGKIFKTGVTIPMHCRAAGLYNIHTGKLNYEPIQNGDKIKYLYLKAPNPIKQNIIGFPSASKLPPELGLDKYIDWDTQFEKSFENPMKSLTDIAGWKVREESSLESFFG